ncbi:MAG: cytochrome ubiquinol oxidase subunit I [Candidatus Moduliflexus flocculans]|nr:cytochrome ubiquinol oxidase subunit I [Candidatus Moduliflexus flocculans]
MLSFLVHFDPNGRVLGLNEFPKEDRPPVLLPFASYHLMILLGLAFIALGAAGSGSWLEEKLLDEPRLPQAAHPRRPPPLSSPTSSAGSRPRSAASPGPSTKC